MVYGFYPRYVTVGEKRAKAKKKLEQKGLGAYISGNVVKDGV